MLGPVFFGLRPLFIGESSGTEVSISVGIEACIDVGIETPTQAWCWD